MGYYLAGCFAAATYNIITRHATSKHCRSSSSISTKDTQFDFNQWHIITCEQINKMEGSLLCTNWLLSLNVCQLWYHCESLCKTTPDASLLTKVLNNFNTDSISNEKNRISEVVLHHDGGIAPRWSIHNRVKIKLYSREGQILIFF